MLELGYYHAEVVGGDVTCAWCMSNIVRFCGCPFTLELGLIKKPT